MALAYGILCHRSAASVVELARLLHHPGNHILLHADRKAPASLHAALAWLAGHADTGVVDSAPCAWGGWSLVDATLRMIEAALRLAQPWSHFVLLSEQHMPLQPQSIIAASLPAGASFIETRQPAAMDAATRADLLHRFAHRYRELPGVGMFAGEARALDPDELDMLRLGSQWVVLARNACQRLAAVREDAATWAPFRGSLVPDETALHSVLRGSPVGEGLDVRNVAQTFVAWPHLGGDADGGFTDALMIRARARGHLFIRKRPRMLPPLARRLLATLPARALTLPEHAAPVPAPDRAAWLAEHLTGGPVVVTGADAPACLLQFATPAASLAVYVVSQDLRSFKVLLAWRRPFDGSLAPLRLGGFDTSVMGVRLPGLTLAREVHLAVPDHGFVEIPHDDLAPLHRLLDHALAAARDLAPLVADAA